MSEDVSKGGGRGRGAFAVAGHERSQEERLAALEDYLGELIDAGTLPAPMIETEEEAPPA